MGARRGASLIEVAIAFSVFAVMSLISYTAVSTSLVGKASAVQRTALAGSLDEHAVELSTQPFSTLVAGTWTVPGTPCAGTPACSVIDGLGIEHDVTWVVVPNAGNTSATVTGTLTVADRSGAVEVSVTKVATDPASGSWYAISSATSTATS